VGAVLAEVAARPDEATVALVAHNGVLRTARVLLGLLDVETASRTPERFAEPDRVTLTPGRLGPSASAP
jgi:broad specificity phosphatase PhoE